MADEATDKVADNTPDSEAAPSDGMQFRPNLGQNIGTALWWRDLSLLGILIALALIPALAMVPAFAPEASLPVAVAEASSQEAVPAAHKPQEIAPQIISAPTCLTAEMMAALPLDDAFSTLSKQANLKVARGDTLMEMVSSLGVRRTDAYYAIEALSDLYNPRKLRVGQDVVATLKPVAAKGGPLVLAGLSIRPEPQVTYVVLRNDEGGYDASALELELHGEYVRASGRISSSLYRAAQDQDMSQQLIARLIRIFSFDVDFQREIREGDSFDVMYERFRDEDGNYIKDGQILFGNLTLRGKEHALYRYTPSDDGIPAYFDEDGNSTKKLLMRTPVDGARLTGRFGNRKHPILGYMKQHKGVDFGASRGTPIMAAGNGVLEHAGRNGSFGIYARIRHNGTYKTAYAHMNGLAKGIKKGATVQQGQIIGYVGSTGRSTGPHLHYEVLVGDKRVNPLNLDLPTGRKLEGAILTEFQALRTSTDTLIASLGENESLASLGDATR